jgi:hypothetical protein
MCRVFGVQVSGGVVGDVDVDEVLFDLCLSKHKKILDLSPQDLLDHPRYTPRTRLTHSLDACTQTEYLECV